MNIGFDPVAYARAELCPMIARLVALTAGNAPEQQAYFSFVGAQLDAAAAPADVAEAFVTLSTAAILGFDYTPTVSDLLDCVLERAEQLSEALAIGPGERH